MPNEKDVLAPLTINALWDTGASSSAICSKIVSDLGLQPLRKIDVTHADGVSRKNLYKVNISLPNKFLIKNIEVIEADLVGNNFDALIGMDIITLGDFSITNVGQKTKFSFRIPSIKEIDYAKEAGDLRKAVHKIKYAGVERNDPCPCGSGKKFKKCHGK